MRRPEWLSRWGKGKNLFEGSLIIDIPEIKVVEASFNKKAVLFAVGTISPHETVVSEQRSAGTIREKKGTDLRWRIFYDSTAFADFMPVDKAKEFMAGTVAVSSGNTSVYNLETVYVPSGSRSSKGNAPLLLDYEMAKKIKEVRNRKTGTT